MGLFARYPASPTAIVESAEDVFAAEGGVASLTESVRGAHRAALAGVDGDLELPVAAASEAALSNMEKIQLSARYASGCLVCWADGVESYNVGIDRLNSRWEAMTETVAAAAMTNKVDVQTCAADLAYAEKQMDGLLDEQASLLAELRREQHRLEGVLDDRAAEVGRMLDAGPNKAALQYLKLSGFLPLPDPEATPTRHELEIWSTLLETDDALSTFDDDDDAWYSDVLGEVEDAASSTKDWAVEHKADIAGVAAGIGAGAGCVAASSVTAFTTAVGCGAVAGGAGGAVHAALDDDPTSIREVATETVEGGAIGALTGGVGNKLSPILRSATSRVIGSRAAITVRTAAPISFVRTEALSGRPSSRSVREIAESMTTNGWQGAPIDVVDIGGQRIIVDGHHRVAAARIAGIDVPYQVVDPATVIGRDSGRPSTTSSKTRTTLAGTGFDDARGDRRIIHAGSDALPRRPRVGVQRA